MAWFFSDSAGQIAPSIHSINIRNSTELLEPGAAHSGQEADRRSRDGTIITSSCSKHSRSSRRQLQLLKIDTRPSCATSVVTAMASPAISASPGHLATMDWKSRLRAVAGAGEEHGLIWGSDWGTPEVSRIPFRDNDHVQRVPSVSADRTLRLGFLSG